jgi:hypothetical protein
LQDNLGAIGKWLDINEQVFGCKLGYMFTLAAKNFHVSLWDELMKACLFG